jgi:hypothetical protein
MGVSIIAVFSDSAIRRLPTSNHSSPALIDPGERPIPVTTEKLMRTLAGRCSIIGPAIVSELRAARLPGGRVFLSWVCLYNPGIPAARVARCVAI